MDNACHAIPSGMCRQRWSHHNRVCPLRWYRLTNGRRFIRPLLPFPNADLRVGEAGPAKRLVTVTLRPQYLVFQLNNSRHSKISAVVDRESTARKFRFAHQMKICGCQSNCILDFCRPVGKVSLKKKSAKWAGY